MPKTKAHVISFFVLRHSQQKMKMDTLLVQLCWPETNFYKEQLDSEMDYPSMM